MGRFREQVEQEARSRRGDDTGTKIGRLILEHPEDRDDLLDLLIGEPRISNRKVADFLSSQYPDEEPFDFSDVNYWRNRYGNNYRASR